MSERFRYITLVSSLPHLRGLFSQAEVPLSEFRLKQRVGMLETEHRRLLERVLQVSTWAGVANCADDAQVIRLTDAVVSELNGHPTLQNLVAARLETRTIIAALRRRRDGQESAEGIDDWGYGRWRRIIAANWTDPGFGLTHFMPWVAEAHQLLQTGEHIAMERLVLGQIFDQLERYAANHAFDFEAVVIYVLRWAIIERWSHYDTEIARTRLQDLVRTILTDQPTSPLNETTMDNAQTARAEEIHP